MSPRSLAATTHSIVRRVPFFFSAFVSVNSSPRPILSSSIFLLTIGGTYMTRPSVSVYSTWSPYCPVNSLPSLYFQCDLDRDVGLKLHLVAHFALLLPTNGRPVP